MFAGHIHMSTCKYSYFNYLESFSIKCQSRFDSGSLLSRNIANAFVNAPMTFRGQSDAQSFVRTHPDQTQPRHTHSVVCVHVFEFCNIQRDNHVDCFSSQSAQTPTIRPRFAAVCMAHTGEYVLSRLYASHRMNVNRNNPRNVISVVLSFSLSLFVYILCAGWERTKYHRSALGCIEKTFSN